MPWHSGSCRVWIHSKTCIWHDKSTHSNLVLWWKQYVIFIFYVFDALNRVFLTYNAREIFSKFYFYGPGKEIYVLIRETVYLCKSISRSLLMQCLSIVVNMYTESQMISMSYSSIYSLSQVINFHLSQSVSKIYCLEINRVVIPNHISFIKLKKVLLRKFNFAESSYLPDIVGITRKRNLIRFAFKVC